MLKNEKGSAMIVSLISVSVILILSIAFIFLSSSNTRHAMKDEGSTQAHYVAKTGVETILKHLYDEVDDTGDMRAELVKIIDRTNAGTKTEGTYKSKKFEIEAERQTRTDKDGNNKTVYLIKGKSKVGTGNDRITAVLTPEYEVEQSWGTGTVDAGKDFFLKGIHNLKGGRVILNTEAKKLIGSSKSPIEIQEGRSVAEDIMSLFDGNTKGDRVVHGFTLGKRIEDSPYIKSETLMNINDPNVNTVELNYGVVKNKPTLKFPTTNGSNIDLTNRIIDVSSPTIGKLVTEEYEVIEFDKNKQAEKKIKNKQILKIETPRLQLFGKNTIITSRNTDVVVSTKIFSLMEAATLNIKGPGKVYIYATEKSDIINDAKIGVELDDPSYVVANTNINFYLKPNVQMELGNKSKANNTFIYGPEARFTTATASEYTGRMTVQGIDFRDNFTLKSPVPGTADQENDPIIGFESIEWER